MCEKESFVGLAYQGKDIVCEKESFVGLAYQGKDIVFRFIIEYSSLWDFGPLGSSRYIFI